MNNYYLRELNLSDTSFLYENLEGHVPNPNLATTHHANTKKAMREYVRQIKDSNFFHVYVWEKESSVDENLAEIEISKTESISIDSAENPRYQDKTMLRTPLLAVFFSHSALRVGTVQVEFLIDSHFLAEDLNFQALLEALFREVNKINSISIMQLHIPRLYTFLGEAITRFDANAFLESFRTQSMKNSENAWIDVYRFSKLENWPYTWVFYPNEKGLLSIYGNESGISTIDWLDYNTNIEDSLVKDLAILQGYADHTGKTKTYEEAISAYNKEDFQDLAPALRDALKQFEEYFAGKIQDIQIKRNASIGTRFQKDVWEAIDSIPYGATSSYEEIGIKVANGDKDRGRKLTRVVGAACGANPFPIVTPCHRVIAKDGKLQGYAFGVEKKDYLLALELLHLYENVEAEEE